MTPDQQFIIKNAISDGQITNKWEDVYVPLYGKGWRSPQSISLKDLLISREAARDVHQEVKIEPKKHIPEPPPGAKLQESFIAVDENYLYIFIGDRWKRTSLSDW